MRPFGRNFLPGPTDVRPEILEATLQPYYFGFAERMQRLIAGVQPGLQEMFGTTETPRIGDRPVRLELLSPARRPVQITSDLAGFWTGSWIDVRKEMAGRYPKHHWPDDPASAPPGKP